MDGMIPRFLLAQIFSCSFFVRPKIGCSFGFAELVTMHRMVPRFLLAKMFSCSFFVRPKKEPKKGRRKYQLQRIWAPATRGLEGAAKKAEVRTLSGLSIAPLSKCSLPKYCFPITLMIIKI
jgi:hypothetical protein